MAAIQLYIPKKSFDAQKAERFFKERRIQVQLMDLKKHKLGEREVQLFIRTVGLPQLLDLEDKKVKEHPAAYHLSPEDVAADILENPWLMKSPLVRCGNKVTVGYHPEIWETWIGA